MSRKSFAKEACMAAATVRDLDDLPAVLTIKHVQDVLGICRPKAYELAHTEGFPALRILRTIRVPKDAFRRWLNEQAGKE
jgi:excisionase family DNA binding protein